MRGRRAADPRSEGVNTMAKMTRSDETRRVEMLIDLNGTAVLSCCRGFSVIRDVRGL